jgi:hypothetical protein
MQDWVNRTANQQDAEKLFEAISFLEAEFQKEGWLKPALSSVSQHEQLYLDKVSEGISTCFNTSPECVLVVPLGPVFEEGSPVKVIFRHLGSLCMLDPRVSILQE